MPEDAKIDDRSRITRTADIELIRAEEESGGDHPKKRFRVVCATEDAVRVTSWMDEVLKMTRAAVDLSRLKNNAPFLADHRNEIGSILGRVKNPKLEDRKLVAEIELADTPEAQRFAELVAEGMAGKVSIGYEVDEWKMTRAYDEESGTRAEYTAMAWRPIEVSAVAVPADDGASLRQREFRHIGVEPMSDENKDAKSAEVKQDPPAETRSADPAPAKVEYNAAGILAMGEAYEKRGVEGSEAKAKEAIRHGHDEAWLRAEIDGLMDARVAKLAAEGEQRQRDLQVGLSDQENRKFSLAKLTRALAFPDNRTYQAEAGLELEACGEARKINQSVVGYAGQSDMSLPQEFYDQPIARSKSQATWLANKLQSRAINVGLGGVSASGGADQLVETELRSESFIEYLYNMALLPGRVMQLPALSGNVDIPRRTGVVDVAWVEESRSAGYAESDGDFDTVSLSPHKLYVETRISHTALLQTDPGIEMLMRVDQAEQKALKLDAGGINGSGTGDEVQGILGSSGINEVASAANGFDIGTNGYQGLLAILSEIGADNGVMGDTMFATDWKLRFRMQGVAMDPGSGKFLWDESVGRVAGFPAVATNQMPRTTAARGTLAAGNGSTGMFFSPSSIMLGTWGTDDILVDPYSRRNQGFIVLSCYSHHDYAIRQPVTVGIRRYIHNV